MTEGAPGETDPLQPHRRVRGLLARDDRSVQAGARASTDPGHGEAHPRTRHRGRLRPVRDGALMERVTGIGGVFFRARDPDALRDWYAEHLGVPVNEGYVIFPESRNTVWAPFAEDDGLLAGREAGHGQLHGLEPGRDARRSFEPRASRWTRRPRSSRASAASAGRSTRREIASSCGSRPDSKPGLLCQFRNNLSRGTCPGSDPGFHRHKQWVEFQPTSAGCSSKR